MRRAGARRHRRWRSINLLGRRYLEPARSPFEVAESLVDAAAERARVILVDMHAEATSEKVAMGRHLAGRVTAVLGTHTHVQTNDPALLARRHRLPDRLPA